MSSHESDSWPVGTRVIVRSPGSWADGLTGVVHHHDRQWPNRCTVQLDGRRVRYLAFNHELRTAPSRERAK